MVEPKPSHVLIEGEGESRDVSTRRASVRLATWLSVIPGLGQLYNRQPLKAATFLLLVAGLFELSINIPGVTGLLLERWMPRSAVIWLSVQMLSVLLFMGTFFMALVLWYDAMHDARRTAQEINGEREPGGRWWWFHR